MVAKSDHVASVKECPKTALKAEDMWVLAFADGVTSDDRDRAWIESPESSKD
jgi:hypothetical protein